MSNFVGFVLVTHNQPEQIALLCRKLSSLFDNPPIVIHHDYSQCHLDPALLPGQVRIVEKWIPTSWGKLSIVQAFLAALELLQRSAAPEWTISLSAADYPIKSAEAILGDLRSTSADGFMDFREISKGSQEPADARSPAANYKRPEWKASAYERYVSLSVVPYSVRKYIGYKDRCIYVSGDIVTRLLTPFPRGYRPFGGDTWITINRRAAKALLADSDAKRALMKHYQRRAIPDESYYHTALLNYPELAFENNNRRFSIWPEGAAHPKLLDVADIPAMVHSDAHFARKCPCDPLFYAAVDAQVEAQR